MIRRNYLRAIGGIGAAAGLGGLTVFESGGAFAQISSITANDFTVSNDRGELHTVTIDPTFQLDWSGFDDAVAKIMMVVEGKYGSSSNGWTPIFRMTPWLDPGGNSGSGLNSSGPGTSGHFYVNSPLSQIIAQDSRYSSPPTPRPIEVVNQVGRPDYPSGTYPSGVTASSYLDGSSLGSASFDHGSIEDDLVNNFPVIDAGYYGAAEAAADANVASDGNAAGTAVDLRYTFGFIRANDSYMSAMYSGYSDSSDAASVSGGVFEASDIDSGNSAFCMTTETSKNYSNARNTIGEPAVLSATAQFTATVENVAAASSGSVSSGTGGS